MDRCDDDEECKTFTVEFISHQVLTKNKLNQPVEDVKKFDQFMDFASSCLPILIVLILLCVVLFLPLSSYVRNSERIFLQANADAFVNIENCNIRLVESIPDGMNYSENAVKFMSTFDAWNLLLDKTNATLDIASLYWTLRGTDVINHTTAREGETIFKRLMLLGTEQAKQLRIAQSASSAAEPNYDTILLSEAHAAEVRSLDFPRLIGAGVLHTKLWIADGQHFYLGSANMDWRSLTQVKELGLLAQNCSALATDVGKIFAAYWHLGKNASKIPDKWPKEYTTTINMQQPLMVNYNDKYTMETYFTNSPPPLTANGRTNDIDGLLNTIATAKRFINIAVMDYFPLMIYVPRVKYWPIIDDALRKAAIERKVKIRMLISWWQHSNPSEDYFLKSLSTLSEAYSGVSLEIKRFVVPTNEDQAKIPYSRVNHNKYMVTDNTAYISTSNWSGDYFTNTAGIALIVHSNNETEENLRTDLLAVFKRDWFSPYALNLKKN